MRAMRALWVSLTFLIAGCAAGNGGEAWANPNDPTDSNDEPASTGKVTVDITGFRNDRGQALVALFTAKKGFPNKVKHAHAKRAVRIKDKRVKLVFEDVPAGSFAVAVHHDEDGDFKMDTGLLGIPKEGYGASRNARRRFGPPKFEQARMSLAAGRTAAVSIRVRY